MNGARIRSAGPAYLCALAVLLIGGLVLQVRFLPAAEFGEDGFQSQLIRVLISLQNGTLVADSVDGALIYVHAVRLLSVGPFLAAELVAGPSGQLALLMLALMPLVLACYRERGSVLCFLPLLIPLAISGRGVLVAAAVGYVVLYMQSPKGRAWHLWLGVVWMMLSSASVLMGMLLLLFAGSAARAHARAYGAQRWLGLAALALALAVSAADKLTGFQGGDAGYEAHGFAADNVLLVALSRSTLAVSYIEGQYLRAVVYTLAAAYVVVKTIGLMFDSRRSEVRKVILCCLPGILLEGMGMLGLCFPLLWLFLRYDPAAAGTNHAST